MGYFGLMVGALVCLGAMFPSRAFERTNMSIALLNGIGVIALLVYSVAWLGSLCLLCTGFYVAKPSSGPFCDLVRDHLERGTFGEEPLDQLVINRSVPSKSPSQSLSCASAAFTASRFLIFR